MWGNQGLAIFAGALGVSVPVAVLLEFDSLCAFALSDVCAYLGY